MKHLEIAKIGENKGAPRVWIEGRKAAIAGFLPGTRYRATVNPERALLSLEIADDGLRIVSKKTKGDVELPVLDLNSHELLSMFAGLNAVRVVVSNNRIDILPVASEIRAKKRLERLKAQFAAHLPVTMGAVSSGIGILDLAAHEGLALAGVESTLAFACEIRDDCMEHAAAKNPAFGPETITLTMPMQELVFDQFAMSKLPEPTIFQGGIPCSGASKSGRSKLGLKHPEDHPEVGHLVVPYIGMIGRLNPVACLLENVLPYRSSASMSILRSALRDLGYDVHEIELDAGDWNMIEPRQRFFMVAVTKGIKFSFSDLKKPEPCTRTFGEVMEDVDPAHSTWGNIDYLWNKRDRDAAAGKGFAPTVIDASSTKVPTQTKNLAKRQSTGTFIQHPTDPTLYRIPTVKEHAALKGVPSMLIENTTQGFGHECLGQAVSMPPVVSIFEALGNSLRNYALGTQTVEQPVIIRENLFAAA